MKRLFIWASLVAIVMGFATCNNDDVDAPLFRFDEDGKCYLSKAKAISHTEFLKFAEGNGWKHETTYEINEDGKVSTESFYEGHSSFPIGYCIEEDVIYACQASHLGDRYDKIAYTYVEDRNQIGWTGDRFENSFYAKYQVISIDEKELKMIEYKGIRSWDDPRDMYTLTTLSKNDRQRVGILPEGI